MTSIKRTPAQLRDNMKDGKAVKPRRRAVYLYVPCGMCGYDTYGGKDRGRTMPDGLTTGHLLAHAHGGTYAERNTFPCCYSCNIATGTRDLRGMVPHGPLFPSLKVAQAWLTENDLPERHIRSLVTPEERTAARKARFGF